MKLKPPISTSILCKMVAIRKKKREKRTELIQTEINMMSLYTSLRRNDTSQIYPTSSKKSVNLWTGWL